MNTAGRGKLPPLVFVVVPVFLLLSTLSIIVTWAFKLPWYLPIPAAVAWSFGICLLTFGFVWMRWTFKSLSIRRAFGQELFKSSSESVLIKTGPYAWCRNPLYFSATVLFLGWFFVFRWTPIAVLTILFFIWFIFVAKWEQRELTRRFGKEYEEYCRRVPFLVPTRRPKSKESSSGG